MHRYGYYRPGSLVAALDVLGEASGVMPVHCLAGGTAITVLARQGMLEPGLLVDLGAITELRGIEVTRDGVLRIGALATLREVETDAAVRHRWTELAHAIGQVASIRVRNQATLGGNLAHADPAQDPPPVLIALDASVEVASPRGRRTIAVDSLPIGPFETSLAPDEILTAVLVPPLPSGALVRFTKFLPRTADDYATVSVAVRLDREPDGRISGSRVVLGAVGDRPLRLTAAEAMLRDRRSEEVDLRALSELVEASVDPVDDARGSAEYKRAMAGIWTRRTIEGLMAHDRSGGGHRP
jgi:carbon-monoxide dehydrogenase medium subunit